MPLVTRDEEIRTPRTRRQAEMDAARQRQRNEEEGHAATVPSEESVSLATLLAAIQATRREFQESQEATRREFQEAMQTSQASQEATRHEFQEALQTSQKTVLAKIDSGITVLGEKVKNLMIEVKEVIHRTDNIESRVDGHDNDLQKITNRISKLETREPVAVVASPSSAKFEVPRFDGTTSWAAFKYQFETLVRGNGWNNEQSFVALTLALRGDAVMILENLQADERTLESLMEALDTRYGDKHMEHVYRAQLRDRTQKSSESLQQWALEVERLVRRAYSSAPSGTIEVNILQAFVDGIKDGEIRAAVRLGHHQTLKSALAHALEVEAVRQDTKPYRVREIVTPPATKRFTPTCYGCGEKGHLRVDCPKRKRRMVSSETQTDGTFPAKSNIARSTGWVRAVQRADSTITITQVYDGNSLIIEGSLNNQTCSFTVDTGASRTVVKPELLKRTILWQRQSRLCHLQTATGQPVSVLGETDVELRIGDQVYVHSVLIANITDDCILGLDFLKSQKCVLDVSRGVLKFPDQEVCLKGSSACKVYCLKDTILAPRSENLVEVKFPKNIKYKRCAIIEDLGHHPNTITARTLVMTQGKTKVRIINLGKEEIHLKKNGVIGRCEEVGYLKRLDSTEIKQGGERLKDDHFGQLIETFKENLSASELRRAKELLLQFRDIFATGNECGRTGLVKHQIDTGDARPIKQRPRRIPWAKEPEVAEMIKDMANAGIIEPSTSPWSSPVVLVRKKDGSTRFCVDYRMLNNVTKKDSYPLPRIDDTLDLLSGKEWFSTIDLKSGYWQVEISPQDKEKTAFSTGIGNGLWQFNVMPFGLCNAPATFERLMERVMVGLLGDVCLVYLDDVIILGRNFSENLRNLEKVFTRIRGANLKLNPKKCALFKREVSYLGHIISAEGVRTDPEKIKAVQEWPVPRNKTEVRSFLGLCAYYRRFVKNFSDIAKPLHQLTEEKRDFVWNSNCQSAFCELKQRMCEAPILGYPSREGRFIVDTDASNIGIGGVLSQIQGDRQVVIAYFSKALSKPERNYCVTRRELLAVVKTLQHFHKYLIGRQFTLRTDHAALKWLLQFKNPEGQVARWLEQLQEFDFIIEHRSGKGHSNADALSRRPCANDCKHCLRNEEREDVRLVRIDDSMKKAQEEDDDLRPILDWKHNGIRPQWSDVSSYGPVTKGYWAQWDSLSLENGVLCRRWESNDGKVVTMQVVVPRSQVTRILRQIHDGVSGGHLGVKKTLLKVRQRFYWLGCREDVENWCRKCTACTSVKGPQTRSKGKLKLYNVGAPWERIAIDVAGPFPMTEEGNKYIVVVQDYFTKWPEVFATPNQEATTVAKKLVNEVVCRYGVPMEIHSDQGRNFESSLFQEICNLLGIHKTRTTPAHPQSDGMVERFNQTLENHLAKVVEDHQRDWDRYIPLFLMSYRSAVHDSTRFTPAKANFGREMRLPIDVITGVPPDKPKPITDFVCDLQNQLEEVHQRVRENSLNTSIKMKTRYDRNANASGFEEGSLVWLHNPLRRKGKSPKLQARWEGPYTVVTKINDVTYRIKKGLRGKPKVVHIDRLARYHGDNARDEHN